MSTPYKPDCFGTDHPILATAIPIAILVMGVVGFLYGIGAIL